MRKLRFLCLLLFAVLVQLSAQNTRVITGKITDDKGAGIAGVSVLVKGSTIGVTTDADGNYKLTAPTTAKTLVFSALNFTNKEMNIGSSNILSASLVGKDDNLSEVVVTSFGIKRDANGNALLNTN